MIPDRHSVDRGDHIAGLNAGVDRRTVRLRLGNERTLGPFEPEAFGNVSGDRLDLHTNPTAAYGALILELTDDAFHRFGWDCECDADRAARWRVDRGVDTDHAAVNVGRRTTGIAAVHGRINLDEVIVGAGADVTPACRHNAGSHGSAQTERIAHRKH